VIEAGLRNPERYAVFQERNPDSKRTRDARIFKDSFVYCAGTVREQKHTMPNPQLANDAPNAKIIVEQLGV